VGAGARLSSRVVVLPGVDIGEGAIVCAGAVVTRSVAAHTMVGGVPARERDWPTSCVSDHAPA
jgi:acetyltransferase-like isoleucine patch superfamily enzyme